MSLALPGVVGQLKPDPLKGEGLLVAGSKQKGDTGLHDSMFGSPFALLLGKKEAPAELATSKELAVEPDASQSENSLDEILTLLTNAQPELSQKAVEEQDLEAITQKEGVIDKTPTELSPDTQQQLADIFTTLRLKPEQINLKTLDLPKEAVSLVENLSRQLENVKSLVSLEQKRAERPLNQEEQQQLNQLSELKEEVTDLLKQLKGTLELESSKASTAQQQQSRAERPDTLALQASFAFTSKMKQADENSSTSDITKQPVELAETEGLIKVAEFNGEQATLPAENNADEAIYSPLKQETEQDTLETEATEFKPNTLNSETISKSSSQPVQSASTDLASLMAGREIKPTQDLRAPASAKTPLAQTQWAMEQAQEKATFEGQNTVRLKLNPDNLGPLTITMSKAGPEGLNARILAATPEALQQLEHELDTLRQNLSEQGLTLKQVTINLAPNPLETSASNPHSGQQQQAFQQASAGFSFQQQQQGFQQAKHQANANAANPTTQGYSGDTTQGSGLESNDTLQAMTPWEARHSRLVIRA